MTNRFESLRFLCDCLSPYTDSEALKARFRTADWEAVIGIANGYFLAPAFYAAFRDKGLASELALEPAAYLEAVHCFNSERNGALLAQIDEASAALNAAGIEPLLLKGAGVLATRAFADPAERFMMDLDLWVGEEKIDAAEQALAALGYQVPAKYAGFPFAHIGQHRPPLQKPEAQASIELHTRLLKSKVLSAALNERFVTAGAFHLSNGALVRVLDPTGQVIHTLLHAQVSHGYHRQRYLELRYLFNFVALCRAHAPRIDWESVTSFMYVHGFGRVLETYLHLARQLFGMPFCADLEPGPAARWCAEAALLPYRVASSPLRAVLRCQRWTVRTLALAGGSLSRETIALRYPTHGGLQLWANRLRHIGYLLRKYRDPDARRLRLAQLSGRCRDWA